MNEGRPTLILAWRGQPIGFQKGPGWGKWPACHLWPQVGSVGPGATGLGNS